ncbi:MAG: hypothetical protein QOG05_5530 [Streptosporangiaceae bacterium]|nr:hypothetical protein [Streptosporangiaceae bacterium]
MMAMYVLEWRGRLLVLGFALGIAAHSERRWVAASSGRWGHSSLTVISREARPPTTGNLAGDAVLLCVNSYDNGGQLHKEDCYEATYFRV